MLTDRQRQFVKVSGDLFREFGRPPTNVEMARVMGMTPQGLGQLKSRVDLHTAKDASAARRRTPVTFWSAATYDRCKASEVASDMQMRLSFIHNATTALREALKAGEPGDQIDMAAENIEAAIASAYRAAGEE